MKNFQFSIFNFQFLLILFILPVFVFADTFLVEVDTGRESINALEGTAVLPQGLVVEDIYTGNSAILFWIKEPILDEEKREISFAGLSPGGFRGEYPIFRISGEFSLETATRIRFRDISATKSDGSGELVPVSFKVLPSDILEDDAPPEPFEPILGSSEDAFGGRYFVSFATSDKGQGIERYESALTWFLSPRESAWKPVSSPLLLSGLDYFNIINIRAIDKAGNYRVSAIPGPYHYATMFGGIIILICILLLLRKRFTRL